MNWRRVRVVFIPKPGWPANQAKFYVICTKSSRNNSRLVHKGGCFGFQTNISDSTYLHRRTLYRIRFVSWSQQINKFFNAKNRLPRCRSCVRNTSFRSQLLQLSESVDLRKLFADGSRFYSSLLVSFFLTGNTIVYQVEGDFLGRGTIPTSTKPCCRCTGHHKAIIVLFIRSAKSA